MKEKYPSYRFFRIVLLSVFLYYLLVSPMNSYLMMKSLPSLIHSGAVDSNLVHIDTTGNVNFNEMDSVINKRSGFKKSYKASDGSDVSISFGEQQNMNIKTDFSYVLLLYLIPIVVLLIFNVPFKNYFNRKRKNKSINEKLILYVKKYLLYSPSVNAGLLFLIFLIGIIKNIITVIKIPEGQSAESGLYTNLLIISVISSALITLFAYFWFRHRVRYKYIELVYSNKEIKERLEKTFEPKVKSQLLLIQGVTTLLPLSVIVFYILLSLSTPGDIGLDKLNSDHYRILIGKYTELIPQSMLQDDSFEFLADSFYINSFDAFLASVGILSSFIVAFIYVLFMTGWLTIQITKPMKALLQRMEEASENKQYEHALIRTNDEFGKLTSGYNLMSDKIKAYIGEIEEMNRNLEKKVVERTIEISNQKNEIEAQRDEIEAQRDEIQAQRDLVLNQKDQIEIIHEEQTSSIRYAQRIQQAMLPSLDIIKSAGLEHFIVYQPRDIVSGDFFWVGKENNSIIIAVADCTGHGVPGAFMSMLGIAYLKEIVSKDGITQPDIILDNLRREIIRSLKQEGGNQRDGMDIALCTINLDTLELQFAGANNPLYIVTGCWSLVAGNQEPETRNQKLIELKGDNMPIGIHERMDPFTLQTHKLQKGDCIYLFSDGIADQFGGTGGKKFKYKQLKELIIANSQKPMAEQKEIIENAFANWKGALEQVDDVTLMAIKL